MYRLLIVLILLSHFETSQAQRVCSKIYRDFTYQKINYKTKGLADGNGRPVPLQAQFIPQSNFDIPVTDFLVSVSHHKKNQYNEALLQRKRIDSPLRGGIKGIGVREQWLYYLNQNFNSFLALAKSSKNLSPEELKFIEALEKTHPNGLNLVMSDNPREFDLDHATHRFAKTSGKIGDPIFINSHMLAAFKMLNESSYYNYESQAEKMPIGIFLPNISGIHMKFETREEFQNLFSGQAEKNHLLTMFSLLLHEAGHYLNIPDDPRQSLDRMATKISRSISEYIEEANLDLPNHDWLKYINVSTQENKKNSQLLLFEGTNIYDVTNTLLNKIKKETSLTFENYSILNLRWSNDQSVDVRHHTTPQVLNFDIVVESLGGDKLIPIRVVNYFSSTLANQHRDDAKSPWHDGLVNLITDNNFKWAEAQILKDKIRDFSNFEPPKITNFIHSQSNRYSAGDVWKTTASITLSSTETPVEAIIYFSEKETVQSGFVKRAKVAFSKNTIEHIGAKSILVHAESQLPQSIKTGRYFISRVTLKYRSGKIEEIEPNKFDTVIITGSQSKLSLDYFGSGTQMMESPKLPGPKPRLRFKMPNHNVQASIAVPLVFELNQVADIQRMSLHGFVNFKDQTQSDRVVGFHIDVLPPKKSPLVLSYSSEIIDNKTRIIVYVALPKYLNGKKVSAVYFESLYLLDKNMQESFDPIPTDFGIDVD
jgi:hypothetical protein